MELKRRIGMEMALGILGYCLRSKNDRKTGQRESYIPAASSAHGVQQPKNAAEKSTNKKNTKAGPGQT